MLGLTLTAFILSVVGIRAQDTSHATCSDSSYNWSFNSLGQSPCEVGEALGNVCTSDGSFNIQYLPAGYLYSGIGATYATNCVCNTVYYSVLNVCAACQGGSVAVWDEWSLNCTTAYSTFPDSIPAGTAIPHYAFQPLLTNGTFDFVAAAADTGADSVGTATSSISTSTRTRTFTSPSQSQSGSSSGSSGGEEKKSSNAGPIAGGVVGGVVGLAIIAGLIFFFWRRKQRANANKHIGPESSFLAPNVTGSTYTPTTAGFNDKIYDPNDPSTFPSTPGTPMQHQGYSPYSPSTPYTASPYNAPSTPEHLGPNRFSMASSPSGGPQTTYRGAPEI